MRSHSSKGATQGAKRNAKSRSSRPEAAGPTQRQLRAGELVRHALAEIMREEPFHDPVLQATSVTVTEVRLSPDMRHATVFVEPLGGANVDEVIPALNRTSRYIRGVLGKSIEMKFTPDLRFVHDQSFDAAEAMNRLFDNPIVQADLQAEDDDDSDDDGAGA
jgi:ribosome-binding factor A